MMLFVRHDRSSVHRPVLFDISARDLHLVSNPLSKSLKQRMNRVLEVVKVCQKIRT
jgi:hypothetical protein